MLVKATVFDSIDGGASIDSCDGSAGVQIINWEERKRAIDEWLGLFAPRQPA